MNRFSGRLKELRIQHGMTQGELAMRMGVPKSSVNMYERGEREPGLETIGAIADCFRVNVDSLLGRETEPAARSPDADGFSKNTARALKSWRSSRLIHRF